MICPQCEREGGRGNTPWTCRDCLAEKKFKKGELDEKTAFKFCECFKAGHNKTKLKPLPNLTKEFQSEKRESNEKT